MADAVARMLVVAAAVYLAPGLALAALALARGLERLDPATRGASLGFRLIVAPGLVALWPLLARRILRGGPPPVETTAHRRQARGAGS